MYVYKFIMHIHKLHVCRAKKLVTVAGFWTKPATVTGWAVSKNC